MFYIAEAFRRNWTIDQVFNASKIDRWFLSRLYDIIQVEKALGTYSLDELDAQDLLRAKQFGLSDIQIAYLTGSDAVSYTHLDVYKRQILLIREFVVLWFLH